MTGAARRPYSTGACSGAFFGVFFGFAAFSLSAG